MGKHATTHGDLWRLVALASMVGGCSSAEAPEYRVHLEGQQRFHRGDDAAWAAPAFDDSAWPRVSLPHNWRIDLFQSGAPFAWYRSRFEWGEQPPPRPLAVDLGVVGWADEVYVNGYRIGATGRLNATPDIAHLPRVYAVPASLLRSGTNVLAVRVRAIPFLSNGLLSSRAGIGDEVELQKARSAKIARTVAVEAVLLGFVVFVWVLVAFMPRSGALGKASRNLWFGVSVWLVLGLLVGITAVELGMALEGRTMVASVVLLAGLCRAWVLIATVSLGRVPLFIRCLIIGLLGVALLTVAIGSKILGYVAVVGGVAVCAGHIFVAGVLLEAVRNRRTGARLLLLGLVIMLAAIVLTIARSTPFIGGIVTINYGLAGGALCALLALSRQIRAMRAHARQAHQYSLTAHVNERARLARDLHDGLGQMLALLKLQLQRTERSVTDATAKRTIGGAARDTGAALEELRRIARDLRPTPLEDRGFMQAVREYAASVTRHTGLTINIIGDEPDLPAAVNDELYRVVQECLTNCAKHADARGVTVRMERRERNFVLTIADDGCGISLERESAGMGLATIKERTEILGGRCTISPVPEGGTSVEVSVPIRS